MKNLKAKKCDISQKTKEIVWERDKHRCILCGDTRAFPNAHYIPRSQGGLGIEKNVVTLCIKCHHDYDFNKAKRKEIGQKIRNYFILIYPDWDESELYFRKENFKWT